MSPKRKKKTKKAEFKFWLIDDSPWIGDEYVKNIESLKNISLKIYKISSFEDVSQCWKHIAPFDVIIVNMSFAQRSDAVDESLATTFDRLISNHKGQTIFFSKFLPDTWSLIQLKDKADVLCVGPDAQENKQQALTRAFEIVYRDYSSRLDELGKQWRSYHRVNKPEKKGAEFETFCSSILSEIEGFKLGEASNKYLEGLADLVIENHNSNDFWIRNLGSPILAECKITKSTRLTSTLYELMGRQAVARAKTVILFLGTKLSARDKEDVANIVRAASSDGKVLLIIDGDALESVVKGEHPDTALKLSYFSRLAKELKSNKRP